LSGCCTNHPWQMWTTSSSFISTLQSRRQHVHQVCRRKTKKQKHTTRPPADHTTLPSTAITAQTKLLNTYMTAEMQLGQERGCRRRAAGGGSVRCGSKRCTRSVAHDAEPACPNPATNIHAYMCGTPSCTGAGKAAKQGPALCKKQPTQHQHETPHRSLLPSGPPPRPTTAAHTTLVHEKKSRRGGSPLDQIWPSD
jgi:hypothetical protein